MASSEFLLSLIRKVAPNPNDIVAAVDKVKRENPRAGQREIAEHVADKITWTYAAQGAVLSLPGTIPGLGTAALVATESCAVSADLALMTRNFANVTFSVSYAYGHDVYTEERLLEVLLVAGIWVGVLKPVVESVTGIAAKIAAAQVKRIPATVLRKVNQKVGTTILTKYGTKRGGIALGKAIPLGIGVIVGGGFNYATMKGIKKATLRYYNDVIPSRHDLYMEE